MYFREAKEVLSNIKRRDTAVIDLPTQLTVVTEQFPKGISYKIEEE